MNTQISTFTIDSYDDVFALWQQCEGVGLSDADSRGSIEDYLTRNPGMSFVATNDGKVVGSMVTGMASKKPAQALPRRAKRRARALAPKLAA